jgi:predicted permease
MWCSRTFETVVQDVRLALRLLIKNPGFGATLVGTMALGIACTATVFAFVDAVLLRRLPVRQPEALVAIGAPGRNLDLNPSYFSQPFYRHLKDSSPVFGDLVATTVAVSSGVNLDEGGVTDRIRVELVSGNYFQVLGIQPAIGRFFTPREDAVPGASPVAVVTYSFWQRRLAGSPDVVGKTVSLNGHPFTIVGVGGRHFFGTRPGSGPDVWAPLMMVGELASSRIRPDQPDQNYLELFARLPERTPLTQAESAANLALRRWSDSQQGRRPRGSSAAPVLALIPMPHGLSLLRGQYSEPLVILMSAVFLLLFIACANVATLLLARFAARGREIALRMSIGATRSRIVRQMVTETLLISIAGGGLGWLASLYLGWTLMRYLPRGAEPWQFAPGGTVFLFAMAISLATGVLFGLAPAVMASKSDLASAVKSDSSTPGRRTRGFGLRGTLSTIQVALSLMLIVNAGLFARTLHNLRTTDMGFRQDGLLLASLDPLKSGYSQERLLPFFDLIQHGVREQPGVVDVGLASHGSLSGVLPIGTRFRNTAVHAEGHEPVAGEDLTTYFNTVTPGYFSAAGLPVLEGRDFGTQDRAGSVKVAIINQSAARQWFAGQNPIGKWIGQGAVGATDMQVVGVVKDGKYLNVRENVLRIVYRPLAQDPDSPMTLHVRAKDAGAVVPYVRRAVQAVDAHVPLFNVQTIDARIDESLRQERLVSTLASWLGLLGTVLAAIGLYGMISYSVAQRTREIGTRMALGATPGHVLRTFVRKALAVTCAGVALGLPLSLLAARIFAGFLYRLSPADPLTVSLGAGLLLLIAALAAIVPAFRAARVDPLSALRHE